MRPIEIVCRGCVVRVCAGFDRAVLVAVLDALEARTS